MAQQKIREKRNTQKHSQGYNTRGVWVPQCNIQASYKSSGLRTPCRFIHLALLKPHLQSLRRSKQPRPSIVGWFWSRYCSSTVWRAYTRQHGTSRLRLKINKLLSKQSLHALLSSLSLLILRTLKSMRKCIMITETLHLLTQHHRWIKVGVRCSQEIKGVKLGSTTVAHCFPHFLKSNHQYLRGLSKQILI